MRTESQYYDDAAAWETAWETYDEMTDGELADYYAEHFPRAWTTIREQILEALVTEALNR